MGKRKMRQRKEEPQRAGGSWVKAATLGLEFFNGESFLPMMGEQEDMPIPIDNVMSSACGGEINQYPRFDLQWAP